MSNRNLRRLAVTAALAALCSVVAVVAPTPRASTASPVRPLAPCTLILCDPGDPNWSLELYVDVPSGGDSGGGPTFIRPTANVSPEFASQVVYTVTSTTGECTVAKIDGTGDFALQPLGDTPCNIRVTATYQGVTVSYDSTYRPVRLVPQLTVVGAPKAIFGGNGFNFTVVDGYGHQRTDLILSSTGYCSGAQNSSGVVSVSTGTIPSRCTFTVGVPESNRNLAGSVSFFFDTYPTQIDSIRFVPGYAPPLTVGYNDPPGRFRVQAYSDLGGDILDWSVDAPCSIENAGRVYSAAVNKTVLQFDLLTSNRECRLRFLDLISFGVDLPVPYRVFWIQAELRPANTAPTSSFTYTASGALPAAVFGFDGSPSSDAEGPIRNYDWDFGNGTTATGATPSVTYTTPGTYDVTLKVTDSGGLSTTSTQRITVAAPVAPGAPTGVAAASTNGLGASVSFTAPASNGGAPITSYRAVCSSTNGGVARSVSGAASPLVVTGLTGGSQYQCRVNATNVAGTGPGSAPSAAFTALGAPGAPTIGAVTNAGAGAVNVNFTTVTATGGSPITSYVARCSSTDGGSTRSATGTVPPILVTTLTRGKAYTCVVRATNAIGTSLASAPTAPFTALATPDAPTGLTATMTTPSRVSIGFTSPAWNGGSPITSYRVVCTPTTGTARSASGASGPVLVTGLAPATTYTCRASATNAQGKSVTSTGVTFTTP